MTHAQKTAKPSGTKGQETPATVEGFVDLLHRHQSSVHKFLHQAAKNGKEMVSWWADYAHAAAQQFRNDETPPPSAAVISDKMATGGVKQALEADFATLSESDRNQIVAELEAHHKYINDLRTASQARISAVIKRTESTPFGPGAYLARWQQLMDNTAVTPATFNGPVRYGGSLSVKTEGRKDVDGTEGATAGKVEESNKMPKAPKVETTLRLLGGKFREVLASG